MKTIQIDNDAYKVPEQWNELTPSQLEFLARVLQTPQPVEQLKIIMMLKVLKANVQAHSRYSRETGRTYLRIGKEREHVFFKCHHHRYLLKPEEVVLLSSTMNFLFRSVEVKSGNFEQKLYPDLDTNPYTGFRIRFRRFRSCSEILDISFEAYMYLQTYLDGVGHDSFNLMRAFACIWHTGKEFKIEQVEKDAQLLRTLPEEKKVVMYWYIIGSFHFLADLYPELFSPTEACSSGNMLDRQYRLLDSLAKHDITKKVEIRKSKLVDVLYSLDEQMRLARERNEEMRKYSHN